MRERQGFFAEAQCAQIWRRYRSGESISSIWRAMGGTLSAVRGLLVRSGGIAPLPRHRSVRVLSLAEREEISRGIAAGESMRGIARRLQRAPSTISCELARHGGRAHYRALEADQGAWQAARRPKRCLLVRHPALQRLVAAKLECDWSPQQIAAWLKAEYPSSAEWWVSHETIYRTLFVQARGALKKELIGHLRTRRLLRRSPQAGSLGDERGQIQGAISIRERPAEAEDRAVPGHWEGDLLGGKSGTFIATLVERHSRFVILVKLPDKRTESVVGALIEAVGKLPASLRRSLTWDRGMEMAAHVRFTVATDVQVYFCDPQSPWQRGSNENTNGLLRQYFPKGADLSTVTQTELDKVANQLNTRPRETLKWKTPAYMLSSSVSMTH